jgi:DNA-binding transcriptional ArsR family regulator
MSTTTVLLVSTDPSLVESVAGFVQAVRLFRLLGSPARVRMLLELARVGEACPRALAAAAGLSRSPANNHLALLRLAGVVEARQVVRRRLYRLASEEVRYILGLVR